MIVQNRRCPRCRGQLYLESDPKAGCDIIQCLHCGHEVGTVHRDLIPPRVIRAT